MFKSPEEPAEGLLIMIVVTIVIISFLVWAMR